MKLSNLPLGHSAVIVKVLGHGAFRKRIMEMGFVRGKRVSVIFDAPLKDPIVYKIMDYEVSLRRSEAAMIEVISEEEAERTLEIRSAKKEDRPSSFEHLVHSSKRTINIALVGNPNSGKTSLFNAASGGHQHVGNYGGVTVDVKRGSFKHNGYRFIIYDLPGTYALSAYSPEEVFVRKHIVDQTPDVIVNVVAASNLERNLYLTTELIDMDCMMVMALNMYDELEASGAKLDYDSLGSMLGVPIVPTVSRSGKGIDMLLDKVIDVYENRDPVVRHVHITHSMEVETAIDTLERELSAKGGLVEYYSRRYLAIKMLERDREIEQLLQPHDEYGHWMKVRDEQTQIVERKLGEDIESAITADKYGFIAGALKENFKPGVKEKVRTTEIIDSFVTNKLFGFPIFIFIMWLMFEATFTLGEYPMRWIESGVELLGRGLGSLMSEGILKDLLINGIIGGVGEVIVFLPNILILYLFISFMEDTGYMARAAFIMDKLMHRMGLHGKSFIPLIMGFGCNVPAIMATRSIESRSSRLITILINPFISCSARLPIYVLLIGTFFPQYGSFVMISLYVIGIVVAIITAKMLRKVWFKSDETPFVMELPPYRIPTIWTTISHMWDKAMLYLRKMGSIILVASIVVWFLSYFPRSQPSEQLAMDLTELSIQTLNGVEGGDGGGYIVEGNAEAGLLREAGTEAGFTDEYIAQSGNQSEVITALDLAPTENEEEMTLQAEHKENSYLGRLGHFVSPVMKPLGFNWKVSVALISGVAAKEIVVSTLGVLYAEDTEQEGVISLSEKLSAPNPDTGEADLTPLSAFALLVFALLYFPCIAAIVAISKESGSWKWAAFSFFYNTTVAWLAAFLIYNIGSLFI